MNTLKRFFCVLLAAIVMAVPLNMIVSFAASPTPVSIKIVRLPDKLKFYKGTDWDYGVWYQSDNPSGGTSFLWQSDPDLISFLYHPFGGPIPERGMIDMTGLNVEITYSDGTTKTVSYKETASGGVYKPNIYAIPYRGKPYFVGTNTIQIYFPSDTKHTASYEIEIINSVKPSREAGDVDGDGRVNSSDALMVLNHSVKIITLTDEQKKYADMNSDKLYNSTDALMILIKSVS